MGAQAASERQCLGCLLLCALFVLQHCEVFKRRTVLLHSSTGGAQESLEQLFFSSSAGFQSSRIPILVNEGASSLDIIGIARFLFNPLDHSPYYKTSPKHHQQHVQASDA